MKRRPEPADRAVYLGIPSTVKGQAATVKATTLIEPGGPPKAWRRRILRRATGTEGLG
jgi:hypothetical protein